jgi:hypothetical protein
MSFTLNVVEMLDNALYVLVALNYPYQQRLFAEYKEYSIFSMFLYKCSPRIAYFLIDDQYKSHGFDVGKFQPLDTATAWNPCRRYTIKN